MKQERAQELYSDYQEGTLSPAMRLALEQHFDADPAARADYEAFASTYAMFDTRPSVDLDVPHGFRAKVLELAAAEKNQQEAKASNGFLGWLRGLNGRNAAARIAVTFAAVASVILVILHPGGPGRPFQGTFVPTIPPSTVSTVIQSVSTGQLADGNTYHFFHVHLPDNMTQAAVTASVITSVNQITDPAARQHDAVSALTSPQVLTSDESLQIPIALGAVPPAGTTLALLVQWQSTDGTTAGSQVVFTPVSDPSPVALTTPTDGTLYDALQTVSSGYGATVIADADSTQAQAVTMPTTSANALDALKNIAAQLKESVRPVPNSTAYQLYKP